jgi:hypothetical protein
MPTKNAQPAPQNRNATTGPRLPVKTFRLGRIKAAVWENEADQKKFYNVSFARTSTLTATVVMTCRWSPSLPIRLTRSSSNASRS